jgi:hypothetical protein
MPTDLFYRCSSFGLVNRIQVCIVPLFLSPAHFLTAVQSTSLLVNTKMLLVHEKASHLAMGAWCTIALYHLSAVISRRPPMVWCMEQGGRLETWHVHHCTVLWCLLSAVRIRDGYIFVNRGIIASAWRPWLLIYITYTSTNFRFGVKSQKVARLVSANVHDIMHDLCHPSVSSMTSYFIIHLLNY